MRRRGARCAIVSVVAPAPFVAGAPTSTTRTNMRAPHRLTTSHCLRSMPCRSGRCARSLHRARNALCSVSCSYVTTIPAQRAAACAAALIFLGFLTRSVSHLVLDKITSRAETVYEIFGFRFLPYETYEFVKEHVPPGGNHLPL